MYLTFKTAGIQLVAQYRNALKSILLPKEFPICFCLEKTIQFYNGKLPESKTLKIVQNLPLQNV